MIASLDPPLTRSGELLALSDPLAREVGLRGVRGVELPYDKGGAVDPLL